MEVSDKNMIVNIKNSYVINNYYGENSKKKAKLNKTDLQKSKSFQNELTVKQMPPFFKSETTIEKTSEKTEEIKKEEGIKSKSNFEIYKYLIGFSLLLFGFFFSAICGFLFFLIFSEDSNTKNDEVPFYFLLPLSLPTFLIILYGNWVATKIFRHS